MSHIRGVAREAVLKAIEVGLGTAGERTAAFPDGATPTGHEAMQELSMFERQIFLYELATLVDRIKWMEVVDVDTKDRS